MWAEKLQNYIVALVYRTEPKSKTDKQIRKSVRGVYAWWKIYGGKDLPKM